MVRQQHGILVLAIFMKLVGRCKVSEVSANAGLLLLIRAPATKHTGSTSPKVAISKLYPQMGAPVGSLYVVLKSKIIV